MLLWAIPDLQRGMDVQVIRRDIRSGAATLLIKVTVDRGISWEGACQHWHSSLHSANGAGAAPDASGPAPAPHPDQADGEHHLDEAQARLLLLLSVRCLSPASQSGATWSRECPRTC